ncbi:hypothetical protein D9M72_559300 [compost metagenome]
MPSYLDGGLASLDVDDLARIAGQPNIEEWLDGATWEQAAISGWEVGKEKTRAALEKTLNWLQEKFE